MNINPTWNYFKSKIKDTLSSEEGKAIYRRRKFDVEPVFGRMKRDFGVRRPHLRGQQGVENDIGLVLMTMNLTKLGKLMAHWGVKMIEKRKNPNCNFIKLKITVRIFLLRGQQTISFFPASLFINNLNVIYLQFVQRQQ